MHRQSHTPSSALHVAALVTLVALPSTFAHETGQPHSDEVTSATPLTFIVEAKGPVAAPKTRAAAGSKTTGQGFWTFVADR
ncbi:MAG: hypothetical protein JNL97_10690, partial [Verrucomicrobiales bacterium]|nr:hypothetical protein [Verrucomicrobiales bacterium]